jgi:hypothetical protein
MAERMLMSVLPFPFHSFVALIGRGKLCPSDFDVFQSSVIRVLFDVRFICCVGCVSCCVSCCVTVVCSCFCVLLGGLFIHFSFYIWIL